MRFLILALLSAFAMIVTSADAAEAPAHIGRHTATLEDEREIRQVEHQADAVSAAQRADTAMPPTIKPKASA